MVDTSMISTGSREKNGGQPRLEQRRRQLRVSRTGEVALRVAMEHQGLSLTSNPRRSVKGARVPFRSRRLRYRCRERRRTASRLDRAMGEELQGAAAGILLAALAHALLAWGRGQPSSEATAARLEELQSAAHRPSDQSGGIAPATANPLLSRLTGLAPVTLQEGVTLAERSLQAATFRKARRGMEAVVGAVAMAYSARLGEEKLVEAFIGLDEACVLTGGRTRLQERLLSAVAEANTLLLQPATTVHHRGDSLLLSLSRKRT